MSFGAALEFNQFILTKPSFQVLYKYFLENPRIDINEGDYYGCTPLLAAVSQNNVPLVKLLIRMGANINQRADGVEKFQGVTALHIAAYFGYKELVELLIDCGAKDYLGYSPYNITAVHCAILGRHDDVLQLLLVNEYKCEEDSFIVLFKGKDSSSLSHKVSLGQSFDKDTAFEGSAVPIKLSEALNYSSGVKILHDHLTSLKYQSKRAVKNNINKGVIVPKGDDFYKDQGSSKQAIQIPHDLSQSLISTKHPFKNTLNTSFGDEITKAVESNDLEKVREMLSKGIQVYVVNSTNKGAHPLILSIQKGYFEMSKLLIDAGASLFSENQSGKCAYDLASPELKEYMDHVLEMRQQVLFQATQQEKFEKVVTEAVPRALSIFKHRNNETSNVEECSYKSNQH